jgi:hypothetical protein
MRAILTIVVGVVATGFAGCASRGISRTGYTTQTYVPPPRVISRHVVRAPVAAVRAPIVHPPSSPTPLVRSSAARSVAPPPPAPLSLELLRSGRTAGVAPAPSRLRHENRVAPGCAPPTACPPNPCDVSALFGCAPPTAAVCDPCPGGNCGIPR